MTRLVVRGGKRLEGTLPSMGAKNAALPIMAACLLVSGPVVLERVPRLIDVEVMISILEFLGAKVVYHSNGRMEIDSSNVDKFRAPYELVKKIHASFDITGPLLARFRQAEVPLPGGCVLGYRGVTFHIDGFRALGAEVELEHGHLIAKASELKGAHILIGRSSVGATKNIMMTACLAKGTTVLENAAREPEVVDLADFLNACGAKISGAGTTEITVEGVKALHGATHRIISDRLEAGTWLLAGAITNGKVTITDIHPAYLGAFLDKLTETGAEVERGKDFITVKSPKVIGPAEILTAPFPGFPTDMQPQFISYLSVADGTSIVTETIFDGRFMYVAELLRMGANISITDRTAVIKGVHQLTGAPVEAPDIRAGVALLLAALRAEGETSIGGVKYIDRGYERPEERLHLLGADVMRCVTEESGLEAKT